MNMPNRVTHEGRSLWSIVQLAPQRAPEPLTPSAVGAPLRHSPPLAAARLAGASRVVAVIAQGAPDAASGAPSAAQGFCVLDSHLPDSANEPANTHAERNATWLRLSSHLVDGGEDVLYLQFPDAVPTEGRLHRDLAIWPALRRRCLEAMPDPSSPEEAPDTALLWMILSRIPAAVLVVNAAGLILRMNPQARRLIREGRILARGRGGLTGATDPATRMLREAVKSCLSDAFSERLLLLPTADGSRVPATLARFPAAADLVTLLVPVPPEPDQVERVARSLGLTATEARVAALLQRGLSNRVAALCMGVQEQSFATYSKRVLSKLNLTSRAEIAQMLTWQSSLPACSEGPAS